VTALGKAIPELAPSDPNGPRGTGEPGRLCPVAGDGSGFYRHQVGKGGVEGVRGGSGLVQVTIMSLSFIVCRAKPRLKMMWCVPVTQIVPPGLRMRHASFNHLMLNS